MKREGDMKNCNTCQHLKRFVADDDSWLDVCVSQEANETDEGLYDVCTVDTEVFDSTLCMDYLKKERHDNQD
jgi:hypothetical protein